MAVDDPNSLASVIAFHKIAVDVDDREWDDTGLRRWPDGFIECAFLPMAIRRTKDLKIGWSG